MVFLLEIEIFEKSSKNDPRLKNLRQVENSFVLSAGDDTHQKWNFNTWRILRMWHLFISTGFYQRAIFKQVKVPKSRGALGMGFTYAPVLLLELYLAKNSGSTGHFAVGIEIGLQ